MLTQTVQWTEVAREIGPGFAARAAEHDDSDAFVADNYVVLRENKVFSSMVPAEFGGGGASHREVCALLRELSHFCPSTALALSIIGCCHHKCMKKCDYMGDITPHPLGTITLENCRQVREAGADSVALISGVFQSSSGEQPAKVARDFLARFR